MLPRRNADVRLSRRPPPTRLLSFNQNDGDTDELAVTVYKGNSSTIDGVFHSGGLYELLDASFSPL